jgi:hypothetical protein
VRIELRVHEVSGEPGPNPAVAEVAGKEHYERRVLELAARHGGRLLCSPVIIARAGMPAALSILEEDSYVKDWNVESVGGDRIADPEIGIVSEGVELDLTPLFDPADESVVLSGRIEFRTIERPIPQTRVKVGDAELSVQLPLVTSWTWNGEVRLERGKDALVVKGLKAPSPQGAGLTQVEVWCLLTVIEEPGAAASGKIVSRDDKFGNIFVKWPRDVVAGDPWDQAPKEVTVYRGAEPIGKAFLTGGWVIGADPDDEFSIIAIYRLAEGAGRDGDSVR